MSTKSDVRRQVSRREILCTTLGVAGSAGMELLLPRQSNAQAITYPSKTYQISGQDAFYLFDNGIYYQYVATRGVGVRQSLDLINWTAASTAFSIPSGGWMLTNQAPWAPEVHLYNGIYYMFTTLHNSNDGLAASQLATAPDPYSRWNSCWRRATIIAEASSPLGPFTIYNPLAPLVPTNYDCLDGTFIVDAEGPWLVVMHEWLQKMDGTIEAFPLTQDLRSIDKNRFGGVPVFIGRGSDAGYRSHGGVSDAGILLGGGAPDDPGVTSAQNLPFVTDGCELYWTPSGYLLLIYSGPGAAYNYNQVELLSTSGSVRGPWVNLKKEPYMWGNRGHGMIFSTGLSSTGLMHSEMNRAATGGLGNGTRSEFYEVQITDNGIKLVNHRQDLDGQLGLPLGDTTPPDLYLPPNQVVGATSPSGAVVTFRASAYDWYEGLAKPVTSSHLSGSTFPIGNTVVTCSATDAAGNIAEASFNVLVAQYSVVATPITPLTTDSNGNYIVQVKIANNGNVTATGVSVTSAVLNSAAAAILPSSIASLAPAATTTVTITFPPSAGTPGSNGSLRVQGAYLGLLPADVPPTQVFSTGSRVVL